MADAAEEDVTPGSFIIAGNVVCETLNDEAVLLNLDTGVYFGLNASGTCVWENLLSHRTYEPAVAQLAARGADEQHVRRDVEKLIEQLQEHGLIRRAGSSIGSDGD